MVYFFYGVLTIFMLAVIVYDASRFLIPNWLVGVLVALWPAMLLVTPYPVEWKIALISFAGCFAFGYLLFAFRLMGGGDVKLLAACALWVGGLPQIMEFLVYMGLLGGVLAMLLLLGRPLCFYVIADKKLPRVLKKGEPVPYGLAIAIAFLIVMYMGEVPGLK